MISGFSTGRVILVAAGPWLAVAALGGCGSGSSGAGGEPGSGGKATTTTTSSTGGAGAGEADAGDAGDAEPCVPACTGDMTCCGGMCTPTSTDTNNCGVCGVVCAAGASCCGGACANLDTNPRNCGACRAACPQGDTCSVTGCSDWATWPMPNPVSAALPNPASYTSMTGYVINNVTKLWWQQPLYTSNNVGMSCSGGCMQAEAIAYCSNLSLGGQNDWRLPTRVELVSIVDYTQVSPAINATAFPDTPAVGYWTSSPYVNTPGSAWYIDFGDGTAEGVPVAFPTSVRCVR